jgi:uncharacterized protein YndB with AHSA1/START domain
MWTYLIYWLVVPGLFFSFGYVVSAVMTSRHRARGTINVVHNDEKIVYTLAFDDDPDEVLGSMDEVLFEIHR